MKEIVYIEPSSIAKITGVIVFGFTLLCIIPLEFHLVKAMVSSKSFLWETALIWLFLAIYPGLGYLVGLLGGYMYNFFAKRIGGIEVEFKE